MIDPIYRIEEQIKDVLRKAIKNARADGSIKCDNGFDIKIIRSFNTDFGDFSTPLPVEMVRFTGLTAACIAEILTAHMDLSNTYIEHAEASANGFINIFLKPKWFRDVLTLILKEKDQYGCVDIGHGVKVLLAFSDLDINSVVWGDCLGNILEAVGYDVVKEYYISRDVEAYLDEWLTYIRLLGVVFDSRFYEQEIYEHELKETLEELNFSDNIKHEGSNIYLTGNNSYALLLEGQFTELASYIAYYRRKILKEGYDSVYHVCSGSSVKNLDSIRLALISLGCEANQIEYIKAPESDNICHNLNRDRFRFSISYLPYKNGSEALFNIHYAHARICSIIRHMDSEKFTVIPPEEIDFSLLRHETEIKLMHLLTQFPHKVLEAAQFKQPNILARYLLNVAFGFHNFYDNCRVRTTNTDLTYARLGLLEATRIVLANALYILNIDAPQRL